MSSTRRAAEGAPLSQERYMSSPEYSELRGISGTAVAAKAALLHDPAKRGLLFFLQALSLQPGGLQKFTREFLEMFKGRIGTPTMHKAGMRPGQIYSHKTACEIEREMGQCSDFLKIISTELMRSSAEWVPAPRTKSKQAAECLEICTEKMAQLPAFIVELCINPRLRFKAPGETSDSSEKEWRGIQDELHDMKTESSSERRMFDSPLFFFDDLIGALFEFKRRHERAEQATFAETEVADKVFETLDLSLRTGKMVVIQGESRIGKTTAAEAWCNLHLGEARFVSLNGIRNYSGVFRAIAKSLGLGSSHAHSTTKVQAKIEEMHQRSRLVLVLDEAHFLLSAAERTRTAPELIDWVNTALCNHRVPVALVCTPQLTVRMARHERQAGWNADQWRGRVKRFCKLPDVPKTEDLRAVARKLLPDGDKESIDYIVGYALSSKLHMPAVVDSIDEARMLAQREGASKVKFEHVERAIREYCAPSAEAMEHVFRTAAGTGAKRGRKRGAELETRAPAQELREDIYGTGSDRRGAAPDLNTFERGVKPLLTTV